MYQELEYYKALIRTTLKIVAVSAFLFFLLSMLLTAFGPVREPAVSPPPTWTETLSYITGLFWLLSSGAVMILIFLSYKFRSTNNEHQTTPKENIE